MNFYCSLIIFTTILSIALGYHTENCNQKTNDPCMIYMSVLEDTFRDKFLPIIDAMTILQIDFAMAEYNNTHKTDYVLQLLNQIIKEEVNQTQIKKFVGQLSGVTYRLPTNITLVKETTTNDNTYGLWGLFKYLLQRTVGMYY
uniref:Secreted protein n=1 Tax=Strongyloides stercoralis TaxID=6248 RepID=A0A0K0E2T9_STRER